MKYKLLFLLLLVFYIPCFAQRTLKLDDIFQYFKFYPLSAGQYDYRPDGRTYVFADGQSLHLRDVLAPDQDSLLPLDLPGSVKEFDQYTLTADGHILLLRSEAEPIYRHSVRAYYYIHNFKTGATEAVFDSAKQQYSVLSPDGKQLAFVVNNNLYFKNLETSRIQRITKDGLPNAIINGMPDWVYEEEFSPVDGEGMVAVKWSPDCSKIAFLRFDERQVPEFPLTLYNDGPYPKRKTFKYPKVGAPNSIVSAHVYDVNTGTMLDAEVGGKGDQYLPRIIWTPENDLLVMVLNRHQDTLDVLQFKMPESDRGAVRKLSPQLLLREIDPAYIEIEKNNKILFLKNKKNFIWMSEECGSNQLYLYNEKGVKIRPLTYGVHEITKFYGVDEQNNTFYYQTASPTPMDRQIWEGRLDTLIAPRLMTPQAGWHEAEFSPTFEYYLLTRSEINTPPSAALYNRAGEKLRTVTENAHVAAAMAEYRFQPKTFFTIPLSDGTLLNAWMLRPPDFDSTKRYPVLFDVYGGPGSQTVTNEYNGFVGAWHQFLAQKGYIIVSVDNRGTGGRGSAFKKMTHLQLGKYETEDQITAARYLSGMRYIDSSRIGIWGWSFGGYLSTSCVLKGNDVFKMAMAVAPVTNWKWYDSAYTERYMHTMKDNAGGYEQNSPVNFARRLRGGNFLVCHGAADDNVHWQQTVELVNALVAANKQYETYYYPNRNHGIYGENATRHLFTKLTDFILKKL